MNDGETSKTLDEDVKTRMRRFRVLLLESCKEIMNLTGIDGMITLAYDEATGVHVFPTENISPEVAADIIKQTAQALSAQDQGPEQLELPLDS